MITHAEVIAQRVPWSRIIRKGEVLRVAGSLGLQAVEFHSQAALDTGRRRIVYPSKLLGYMNGHPPRLFELPAPLS
jgi:uncharacterized protein YcgI (DUF1989 family)